MHIIVFCPLGGDKEVDSLLSPQEKCHIPMVVYSDRQKTVGIDKYYLRKQS